MHALFIDPFTREITAIQQPAGLTALYSTLGCDMVEAVRLDRCNVLWVDEEGYFKPPVARAYFRINGNIIANKGLVLGVTPYGDNKSTTIPLGALAQAVSWVDVGAVRQASARGAFDGYQWTDTDGLAHLVFRPDFG